jgi:hypothetical protein
MFRNSQRDLSTHEPARGPAADHDAQRGRWKRSRRPAGAKPQAAAFQFAICPKCRLMIRDRVAITAGYCGRCQDFTLMCAAGRRLVSPDVTTRTSWHWPCTATGTARWQVTKARAPVLVLLCADHAAEVAAGRVSWIEQPTFMGDAWPVARL